MQAYEANFDGIVGPTHNYSGLSFGNTASMEHKNIKSNPRKAALQGLEKMKLLMDLNIAQGVLPPPLRPDIQSLKNIGFSGSVAKILEDVERHNPTLLHQFYSAAAMWTANAATVSSSANTKDHKVHITPANLVSNFHRSIESTFTYKTLSLIFNNQEHFKIHHPLPPSAIFADEGAANHNAFTLDYGKKGVELFVYGKKNSLVEKKSTRFPERQTLEASMAIARLHGLDEQHVLFAEQNKQAIDLGVFHNDVIAVANSQVFLLHEYAFESTQKVLDDLQNKFPSLIPIIIQEKELSVKEAVSTYFFNSQLISSLNNKMILIAPKECEDSITTKTVIEKLLTDKNNPIEKVFYVDIKESMKNGGGPACLRLRVPLTKKEMESVYPEVWLTEKLYNDLKNWISRNYREELVIKDFTDPLLYKESENALIELSYLLKLPSLYL